MQLITEAVITSSYSNVTLSLVSHHLSNGIPNMCVLWMHPLSLEKKKDDKREEKVSLLTCAFVSRCASCPTLSMEAVRRTGATKVREEPGQVQSSRTAEHYSGH